MIIYPRPRPTDLEVKRMPARLSRLNADGTFEGYASLFHRTDLGGDRVKPGAFRRSLERRGPDGVKLLWQHDPAEPIGRWLAIGEDGLGLRVRGLLLTDLARAREAAALLDAGAVDGLSIGFRTVRASRDTKSGRRDLIEIDLWEISIVTFPLLPDARIAPVSVRHALRPEAVSGALADAFRRGAARLSTFT
ncbi:HK97 family phage prohead protease [Segnochrobactrum spirostomi]|uniref:HK97 family phage prohead protease n=1 Tax=Segnochrobactrum spirostomi TaxID=2608987 RepID=A0A6A7Y1S6_9HYPH|nr:HK97 family phage prohead protease [Segnochrobactrum spirostomi]MQT12327.1 HK97 family phage prohead protease [Segnochrobactrum spirostomi]